MVRHDDVFLTKKQEILQKIEEKKRLISLTKAMSGEPTSEGGMSREKAQRTIELFNKDISKLEKYLMQLEKPIPSTEPPKVEEKYRSEYVETTYQNDSIMRETPIKSLNWFVIIILLIIISSSLYFVIDNSNLQNTNNVMPSNFSNNAEKITNPILTPKDIFDKINEYREQNKKFRILWSDDAYRLADFRASDMVKRNYFSRTAPDGKTVSDYIGFYNFYSSSAWGENLCKGCSDPTQTWIENDGHKEILLGGWGRGAVACESDICVFIGINE